MRLMRTVRHRGWQGLALLVAALVLSSCGWRGISNVAIPGLPGTGAGWPGCPMYGSGPGSSL